MRPNRLTLSFWLQLASHLQQLCLCLRHVVQRYAAGCSSCISVNTITQLSTYVIVWSRAYRSDGSGLLKLIGANTEFYFLLYPYPSTAICFLVSLYFLSFTDISVQLVAFTQYNKRVALGNERKKNVFASYLSVKKMNMSPENHRCGAAFMTAVQRRLRSIFIVGYHQHIKALLFLIPFYLRRMNMALEKKNKKNPSVRKQPNHQGTCFCLNRGFKRRSRIQIDL